MGKASRERAEKGGREGSLVYCFCGLRFSHGNLSEKDLSLPAPLGCPALAALTFLPPMPSSLSCRGLWLVEVLFGAAQPGSQATEC